MADNPIMRLGLGFRGLGLRGSGFRVLGFRAYDHIGGGGYHRLGSTVGFRVCMQCAGIGSCSHPLTVYNRLHFSGSA